MLGRTVAAWFGVVLLCAGLYGLATGKTPGWQHDAQGRRILIDFGNEPVTYVVSMLTCFAGGVALVCYGLRGRGGRDRPEK
jgi:hypothetical protein